MISGTTQDPRAPPGGPERRARSKPRTENKVEANQPVDPVVCPKLTTGRMDRGSRAAVGDPPRCPGRPLWPCSGHRQLGLFLQEARTWTFMKTNSIPNASKFIAETATNSSWTSRSAPLPKEHPNKGQLHAAEEILEAWTLLRQTASTLGLPTAGPTAVPGPHLPGLNPTPHPLACLTQLITAR